MKKAWNTLYNIILFAVVIFSIIIIFSSMSVGGNRMFVVKSGSMSPKIPTGSIVVDIKQTEYNVGDVITFKVSSGKDTVTHRIVEVLNNGYRVRGDANDAPDKDLVPPGNIVGKVIFSIPLLGYLVAFVKTVPGLIIFIVIPATIIVYEEIGKIKEEIKKLREEKRKIEKKEREILKKIKRKWQIYVVSIKKWMDNNLKEVGKTTDDE